MHDTPISVDEIWTLIKEEARRISLSEPALSNLLDETILSREDIFDSISLRLARKLGRHAMGEVLIYQIFQEAFAKDSSMRENVVKDIIAIKERDPACQSYINPILYFKGFQSITVHRAAHWLWMNGRKHTAYYFQSLSSEIFGVDIHPAARFGGGILLDHATSFVAGETSVVEDNVSILHEVTLGGTGNETGDRHPKVMSGVLIGAGAKLIGNIKIGRGAKIGAGSVVLDDVPAHTTVAGVPAHPVSSATEDEPALEMNQKLFPSK
ncbi:MAG: serine O-acetyltransferase [Bacilli bacterium]